MERYARSGELASFLADVLALGVIHGRQEIVEIPEPGIGPVKLHALAHHEARTLTLRRFPGFGKENMQRRQPVILEQRQRAVEELSAQHRRAGNESWAGGGRKGNGTNELRIVTSPVAAIRVGPRPIKNVLAVGMSFDIKRHGADQLAGLPCGQIARRPAGLRRRASCLVQRVQKSVRQKRRVADQRVPRRCGKRSQRIDNA